MQTSLAIKELNVVTMEEVAIKQQQPSLCHVLEALQYRVFLSDLIEFFNDKKMPSVARCLKEACAEIDQIWEEDRFNSGV